MISLPRVAIALAVLCSTPALQAQPKPRLTPAPTTAGGGIATSAGIPATPAITPPPTGSNGPVRVPSAVDDAQAIVKRALATCVALDCAALDKSEAAKECRARKNSCDAALKNVKPMPGAVEATTVTPAERAASAPASDCTNPSSPCFASYWRRRGIDLDELAKGGKSQDLERLQQRSTETAGSEIIFAALGGLQTFLTDRAKAEAVDYTVGQLKGRLCAKYSSYLPATCELLNQADLDLDEATLLRLRRALLADFQGLPVVLIDALPKPADANDAASRLVIKSGMTALIELATKGLPPKSLPQLWAELDRAGYGALTKLDCQLGTTAMPGACWALLLPELGQAAVAMGKVEWSPENVAQAMENGAIGFCHAYGPAAKQQDGACLLESPTQLETVLASFKALASAAARFATLEKSVDSLAAQGIPPLEIAARMLPEFADAFEKLGAVFDSIRPAAKGIDQVVFDRVGVSLRAMGAVAARDYATFVAIIAAAVKPGQPLDGVKLPADIAKWLDFAARLAAAKSPADAKKAFEDAAAPLGSYKVKYDREQWTVAVNAFIGPFVGYGARIKSRTDTQGDLAFRPLSAPLGLDLSAPSSTNAHVGLMLSVIDPFAAGTIDSASKAEDFDWGAVFTPGLFVRVGLFGSPFTVLGGAVYQPFAKSKDECTNAGGNADRCWKGQLQLGGALAIDVPLLVLH
jgi:hypothetical protein